MGTLTDRPTEGATNEHGVPAGTVAVGVDGSPGSEAALRAAVDAAAAERRALTIVHAGGSGPPGQQLLEDARAAAERRAPGLQVHQVLRMDDARDLLVAVSQHAATLVVGSRGRGLARSLLLGSVSLAVTRRAGCPVVVVRPHHPGLVRHGVLVGADASPASTPTLAFAFAQAAVRRLPLTVMHVVEPDLEDPEVPRLLLAEAMAGLQERYPEVTVSVEVVQSRWPPDAALLAAAERMDLTVVGTHHGGIGHRSVVNAVIERARCPVAVVPLDTRARIRPRVRPAVMD